MAVVVVVVARHLLRSPSHTYQLALSPPTYASGTGWTGVHVRYVKPGSMFALLVVLPAGTAVSGVFTWSLFGNVYGGLVFVGLFVLRVVTENYRQTRITARRAQTDAEVRKYISGWHDAARQSGVDLSPPPQDV
ncbi:hypothetical protein MHPYR_310042 [uncultured Mycobacterium sp.]|uniref:Uncharacterized protein n=1 Tax=uncultured Mycobacterium sp. TaxID=171292 RepID=A0A1Y5PKE8_9MYCO|nr:hypothetical protein MHPYR_310042 [uncultured Mycobacterium sp.]